MALRGWSWDAVIGPAGLGDHPLLEALEAAIPTSEQCAVGSGRRTNHCPPLTAHCSLLTRQKKGGAFPQLRVVALIETGTHALCDAVLRPFRCGEAPAALRLRRSVGPGMLLLWDRGFHS
jgi:hypothetical protein